MAGGSAPEGIREIDGDGSIMLIGWEPMLPYDRPALSKRIWYGQKRLEDMLMHSVRYYSTMNVDYVTERKIVDLDTERRVITDNTGRDYHYEKLLIATGSYPRTLPIPGGDLKGVSYYRSIDDYISIRAKASPGKKAVIIGGGYLSAELSSSLSVNGVSVTLVFPEKYLLGQVFPENLGRTVQREYAKKGITVLSQDFPDYMEKKGDSIHIRTVDGKSLTVDFVIASIGVLPSVEVARMGGISVDNMNGIIVNEFLETSHKGIYAAGDNAFFPYIILGKKMRVEHWDNAIAQGRLAGRNMAGAKEPYSYMPYFFTDLFDFHFEAVGNIDSRLIAVEDWLPGNRKGIVCYYREGKVVGVMMCNLPGRVEMARKIIRYGKAISLNVLEGIPA